MKIKYLIIFLFLFLGITFMGVNYYNNIMTQVPCVAKKIKPFEFKRLNARKIGGIDTTIRKILLIGDSQAYFFMKGLKYYTDSQGNCLNTVSWVSASIKQFAKYDTLTWFLKAYQPSFVLVILGSNQLPIRDSAQLALYVKQIDKRLKDYYSIWIGPLKRHKEVGLNEILKNNLPQDRFFCSNELNIPRKAESWAHPNNQGSKLWADTVAQWIMCSSRYKIRMKKNLLTKHLNYTKLVLKPLL